MKLVTYVFDDCERIGSLNGDRVVDLKRPVPFSSCRKACPLRKPPGRLAPTFRIA